jgi:NhaP-type Na+/H+ and K+/H+ antiporter
VPLASWAVALATSALAGYALFRDKRVQYDVAAKEFFVPGSWVPLAVIMAIFFAKYVYAVMHALNAHVIAEPMFVVALSAVYGLLSGYFAARAMNLINQARKV